nr:DUF4158 domain-containing protein [Paraburkholderia madseniana]
MRPFTVADDRAAVGALIELATQTDKSIVLARALIEYLCRHSALLPAVNVIDRLCAEAVTRATRNCRACSEFAMTASFWMRRLGRPSHFARRRRCATPAIIQQCAHSWERGRL